MFKRNFYEQFSQSNESTSPVFLLITPFHLMNHVSSVSRVASEDTGGKK